MTSRYVVQLDGKVMNLRRADRYEMNRGEMYKRTEPWSDPSRSGQAS